MLWLALHFPRFAMEVYARSASLPHPFAVAEQQGRHARVVDCNEAAAQRGVRRGMVLAAARAMAPELVLRWRDMAAEAQCLAGVAAWAGRFTPTLSLQPPHGLLLEISGCLRLYQGYENLLAQVQSGLDELGYQACAASAPTPHAAWLLACAGRFRCVYEADELEAALHDLPMESLRQPEEVRQGLASIGARTLEDCWRLPRAGLARRFGTALLDELDRALGKVPEAREIFVAPPSFRRRLELPAGTADAEALLFAAHRLLLELEGFLTLRQAGVQELELSCCHERVPASKVSLGFARPERQAGRMRLLLREMLGRARLAAAVVALVLEARHILPLPGKNAELLPDAGARGDGDLLLERLRARLGKAAVHGLAPAADHRPERAWRACEAGEGAALPVAVHRPLWLLPQPVPYAREDLVLQGGPERIECGWWDDGAVARDYYAACDGQGANCWVYRDRASGEWFLHGLFA